MPFDAADDGLNSYQLANTANMLEQQHEKNHTFTLLSSYYRGSIGKIGEYFLRFLAVLWKNRIVRIEVMSLIAVQNVFIDKVWSWFFLFYGVIVTFVYSLLTILLLQQILVYVSFDNIDILVFSWRKYNSLVFTLKEISAHKISWNINRTKELICTYYALKSKRSHTVYNIFLL